MNGFQHHGCAPTRHALRDCMPVPLKDAIAILHHTVSVCVCSWQERADDLDRQRPWNGGDPSIARAEAWQATVRAESEALARVMARFSRTPALALALDDYLGVLEKKLGDDVLLTRLPSMGRGKLRRARRADQWKAQGRVRALREIRRKVRAAQRAFFDRCAIAHLLRAYSVVDADGTRPHSEFQTVALPSLDLSSPIVLSPPFEERAHERNVLRDQLVRRALGLLRPSMGFYPTPHHVVNSLTARLLVAGVDQPDTDARDLEAMEMREHASGDR